MARARNIKPSFFTNEELVELPFEVRLLFIGLWTLADREGRMEDRPKRIKMALFPADGVDVDAGLNMLQERGFVLRYKAGQVRAIQVLNFAKHQSPHIKESPSEIQAPDEHGAGTMQAPDEHGASRADCLNPESPLLNPEPGTPPPSIPTSSKPEKTASATPSGFAEFWAAYPKKVGKGAAERAWRKAKVNGNLSDLLQAIDRQKWSEQWRKDGGQFIPNPATWINEQRWHDELPSAAGPPARASPYLSARDAGRLAAARTIFGTEIEETSNAADRTIDVTPTASGTVGVPDLR